MRFYGPRARQVQTPWPSKMNHRQDSPPLSKEDHLTYRSIVGELAWISNASRPDLAHAVSLLSQQLSAVSGEKADAFWEAVDKLKEEWKMEKGDLCKFMSDGVAAAVSGEKADAFWEGMACLRPFLTPAQMSSLMSDGVACRMKKRGYGRDIATIVHRLGFDTAKGLLRDTSVLNVVPELAASVSDEVPGILRHGKRKALFFERLKSQKLAKLQDRR